MRDIQAALSPWTDWVGEAIGLLALLPLILFAITYQVRAEWKRTRPGRAIMYLARGLAATIILLITSSLIDFHGWRWVAEFAIYAPLAWACWNLYYTLIGQLGGEQRFMFRVGRKPDEGEDMSYLEDTKP